MPFKPLSNALLSPYKVPFGVHLYNYLITKNLRRLLNNSFFHPSPRLLCIFCQYILMGGGYWGLDVEWWVLMVSIKFIVNPHIIITQHSIPHIINTQHSSPITHPPTFNPTYHQHSTFIPQHPSPNIQSLISSTLNIHHPTPNTQHSTPHIIITQHSIPTHHQHPTFNTHHPTFNPHTSSTPNIQHPSPNIQPH